MMTMTSGLRKSCTVGVAVLIPLLSQAVVGRAQSGDRAGSGISLAPSVVTLKGVAGQSHRQTVRLTNHTSQTLTFDLVAEDVLADGNRRVFVQAGDHPDSIAATAVFSPREIVIEPGQTGSAEVTLTVPRETRVRAVAAIFRGRTTVTPKPGVSMIASLGCLITFSLTSDARLEASIPEVSHQTETSNVEIQEWVSNVGSEPVVPSGVLAVLDASGTLVGRVTLERNRLLPGERLRVGAEYPSLLPAGRYRGVLSLEYDKTVVTRTVDFAVGAPAPRDLRLADRNPGVQP
jgi:hypothetical protein